MNIVRPLKACKHTLTNVLIELRGDIALSEAHYLGFQRQWDEATQTYEDYFNAGRYLDRFERRAGQWKIVRRVGLIDYERHEPIADRLPATGLPDIQKSHQFPDDVLYKEFLFDGSGH